jgi:DNA-binding NarL/FixJ family response regulator
MQKLRIFLADDHAVVREGLKALISAQPDMEVVGEASDGREALRAADYQTDVVVMDVSMPELNGTVATAMLRQACPDIRVLALSVHEDTSYLRGLLEAGAAGYVLKRAAAETLVHAIRSVAAGEVYLESSLANRVVSAFVGRTVGTPVPLAELSEREAEVLRLIARGYSNREIAVQLGLSIKTVETYKARGMLKLGIDSRVDLVRHASAKGWL